MWAANLVVAPTLGSTITIPETANEFSIKGGKCCSNPGGGCEKPSGGRETRSGKDGFKGTSGQLSMVAT
uniref:Uncharacterized protein n=1 Tax=Tanacetum cinerariifolium TaxID=118510 RepID=A0A699J951_TANCI|nr:hypothetical protein [Tanacetum cinerariifolium]